jgi:trigger factor
VASQSDSSGAGSGRGSASLGSIEADRIKRMVDKLAEERRGLSPRALPRRQLTLPAVKAPSLEDLRVTVPGPEELLEEDVLGRLHELALESAETRDRASGEPIQMGDLILIDTLGYAEGRLIPFSARSEMELEMAPQAMIPGFCEALVGTPVGDGRELEVVLPDDYPIESLRGVKATFLVDVLAAKEVDLPDPESQEFLHALGRGATLDEVMASIVDELSDEQAEELWLEAQERVLDELVLRLGEVQVPPELVDEEIREHWKANELPLLQQKDFAADELQEALEGWLGDTDTRVDAERRIRVSLALRAILEAQRLQLTPARLEELLGDVVQSLGMAQEDARQALADPETAGPVRDMATHLMAVEYVMSRARIQFEGVPGTFPGRPPRTGDASQGQLPSGRGPRTGPQRV